MYVRRNHLPLTPPANYAGVAFSSDAPSESQETKIHKAENVAKSDISVPFKIQNEPNKEKNPEPKCEIEEIDEEPVPQEQEIFCNSSDEYEKCEQKGLFSDLFDTKLSIEDVLLFASLFLLASGQIDDEILVLAGILLIVSHA